MSERRLPAELWEFEAIGVPWAISTFAPLTAAVRGAVAEVIADYDLTYSRFRPDSVISWLAARGGAARLPDSALDLDRTYRWLGRVSSGAISPWVGASLAQLGYDGAYRLSPAGAPMPAPAWDSGWWSGRDVQVPRGVMLDVGAAGKGQLVDLVTSVLGKHGVEECVVDASGDLRVRGDFALRVGLEHPYDPARVIGVVELRDLALAASASNRRAWGDGLHHIIDARTGSPVHTVVASWAVAPTCLVADAVASALFFAPADAVEAECGAKGLRVLSDGKSEGSREMVRALV